MAAIREKVNISERRACRLVGLSRSVLHYDAKPDHENEVLAKRLVELAHERRRFGYCGLHALVEREGTRANHKRIYRLYREAVRIDQGPEFTRRALDQWAYSNSVTLKLIQAGKPTQNAYIQLKGAGHSVITIRSLRMSRDDPSSHTACPRDDAGGLNSNLPSACFRPLPHAHPGTRRCFSRARYNEHLSRWTSDLRSSLK